MGIASRIARIANHEVIHPSTSLPVACSGSVSRYDSTPVRRVARGLRPRSPAFVLPGEVVVGSSNRYTCALLNYGEIDRTKLLERVRMGAPRGAHLGPEPATFAGTV